MSDLEHIRSAIELLKTHLPVVVYDVETTGLDPKKERIIQFSGMLLTWSDEKRNYVLTEEFNRYIRPPFPVSPLITRLTGISNEMLKQARTEEMVCMEIMAFFDKGEIFVGYNNVFDDKMIDAMTHRQLNIPFQPEKRIDVMQVIKEIVPKEKLKDHSYKLCNVAEYFNVVTPGFHNASVDIQNTWDVLLAAMIAYSKNAPAKKTKKASSAKTSSKRKAARVEQPVLIHAKKAKEYLEKHLPVIVYDVETTGLKKETDRIIQFSGFLLEWDPAWKKYVMTEQYNRYIKPPFTVSEKITKLTGITNEFLQNELTEEEVFMEIISFMSKGRIFVGYNSDFDAGFLDQLSMRNIGKHFMPNMEIDVMKVAKELIDMKDLKDQSFKLCNVSDYYKVVTNGFHNAMVDIQNTWDVLLAEMDDLDTREEITYRKDFNTSSITRWKMSYGRNSRYDRFYVSTTLGEVIYDLVHQTVYPKYDDGPRLDPEILIFQMDHLAKQKGFKDLFAVDGTIKV